MTYDLSKGMCRLMTEAQAAIYLSKSTFEMRGMRLRGAGPPYVETDDSICYPSRGLANWKMENE